MNPTLVGFLLCSLLPIASTSAVYDTTAEPNNYMTEECGLIGGAIGMIIGMGIGAVALIVVLCVCRRTKGKVKRELENQKSHLTEQLQLVESGRDDNKTELQDLETNITDSESSDHKSSLLGQKEKLLKSQWELDMKKKEFERHLLNIETALEPIETGCCAV